MVQNTGKVQWHPALDAAGHTDCEKRRQLESEENLRTDLEGSEEINELVRRYEERKSSHYYQAVMDLIVRANKEKIEEERYMCEALHELFAEDVEKAAEKAAEEAAQRINTLNKILVEQNRTADIIKAATEPEYQKKLMEELGIQNGTQRSMQEIRTW